jgi:hypothetical protein
MNCFISLPFNMRPPNANDTDNRAIQSIIK